jgi:two-component system cell cycle response regulator
LVAKPVRILVVDNSKLSQRALAHVLRAEIPQVEVICCESAKEAIEHLQAGEGFDMITTSLMLADMDGLELVRNLRSTGGEHRIPLVVVSARAEQQFARSGGVPGVSDYFDKSSGYGALGAFIKDFVERNFAAGRILYVEDDMVAGKKTQQLLERYGFEVVHVTGARQAQGLLEQTRGCEPDGGAGFFDLVLSDYYLREGATAASLLHTIRVKLHYSPQQLPVLVVTVSDDPERQVEVFRAGANDFVTKPYVEDVFLSRVRSLVLLSKQFKALYRQSEELRRLAAVDRLTGVHDRSFLSRFGAGFLAEPGHRPAAVMLVEIDRLDRINREHGIARGDRLLSSVAELLSRCLGEASMVIRSAGTEFCCLIPLCTRERGMRLAQEVRTGLRAHAAGVPGATLSIGVVSAADLPDADLQTLMERAGRALARAKREGRDRAVAAGVV